MTKINLSTTAGMDLINGHNILAFPSTCCGGVQGGVHGVELLLSCSVLLFRGGINPNQKLLGLGPNLTPPQLSHGGVGGGVYEDLLLGEERSGAGIL